MKIAIISDTHNNSTNLNRVLAQIQPLDIHTIIHCGDLIRPDELAALSGFRLIFTFGNGDTENQTIRETILKMSPGNYCGFVYTGEIQGVPLAVTHGHIAGKVEELCQSGSFRFVFHGHSHRRRDDLIENTRVINPGALGGLRPQERSFCILDLETGEIKFIRVDDNKT